MWRQTVKFIKFLKKFLLKRKIKKGIVRKYKKTASKN